VDNVRIDASRTAEAPADRLLVPEAFGNAIRARTERPPAPGPEGVVVRAPAPAPAPAVEPEPPVVRAPEPVAEPRPVPTPAPAVEPEPPVVRAPEPVVVRAAEPEPEPPQMLVPEPVRAPDPVPVVVREPRPAPPAAHAEHDHVRQLRLEVATSEAAELEELLQEAIADEHEALTRTAIIRERLREALATIAELSGNSASVSRTATRGQSTPAD